MWSSSLYTDKGLAIALVKRKPLDGEDNDPYGRVYIFELELQDGTVVRKVGMVNSDSMGRVTDRLMEVLRSFFMQYRYVPKSRIVKAKKFRIPYYVETYLHRLLDDIRYKFDKKFDGCKEFFVDLDVDEFSSYLDSFQYSELLKGETKMAIDRYEAICAAIEAESGDSEAKGTDTLPF